MANDSGWIEGPAPIKDGVVESFQLFPVQARWERRVARNAVIANCHLKRAENLTVFSICFIGSSANMNGPVAPAPELEGDPSLRGGSSHDSGRQLLVELRSVQQPPPRNAGNFRTEPVDRRIKPRAP